MSWKNYVFNLETVPHLNTEALCKVSWSPGELALLGTDGRPRIGIFAYMHPRGYNSGIFADGEEHRFYTVAGHVNKDGRPMFVGGHVIPVFPNGDLLIIINRHRPGPAVAGRACNVLNLFNGKKPVELKPTDSPEFPGGTFESEDDELEGRWVVKPGALRELREETGLNLAGRSVRAIQINHPVHQWVSDALMWVYYSIVYIPDDVEFSTKVDSDGGLDVLRISQEAFNRGIVEGVVCGGSALEGMRTFEFVRSLNQADIERYTTSGTLRL